MILKEETFKKFGYYPSSLKLKSHKMIIVKCDKCGKIREIPNQNYRDLCHSCGLKKDIIFLLARHNIQKDDIIRLYVIEKFSLADISIKYNISITTAGKYLKKLNVQIRKSGSLGGIRKIEIDKSYLKELYEDKKMTIGECAKKINSNNSMIYELLKFFNISIRKRNYDKKGKHFTLKTKRKMSESHKGQHTSPKTEFKKGHKKSIKAFSYQSSWEKNYERNVLLPLNESYKKQFRLKNFNHPFDFAIPKWKLLIEIDSDYWHSFPKAIKRDKEVSAFVEKSEWNMIRITEENLKEWGIVK